MRHMRHEAYEALRHGTEALEAWSFEEFEARVPGASEEFALLPLKVVPSA